MRQIQQIQRIKNSSGWWFHVDIAFVLVMFWLGGHPGFEGEVVGRVACLTSTVLLFRSSNGCLGDCAKELSRFSRGALFCLLYERLETCLASLSKAPLTLTLTCLELLLLLPPGTYSSTRLFFFFFHTCTHAPVLEYRVSVPNVICQNPEYSQIQYKFNFLTDMKMLIWIEAAFQVCPQLLAAFRMKKSRMYFGWVSFFVPFVETAEKIQFVFHCILCIGEKLPKKKKREVVQFFSTRLNIEGLGLQE